MTPATDPAELAPGWPGYDDILAARADRMAVMRGIVAGLTDADLGRPCQRSPAPGYPDEERTVIDCLGVVMNEEIEHYRFAVRDLAALEATWPVRGIVPERAAQQHLAGAASSAAPRGSGQSAKAICAFPTCGIER